MPNKKVEMLERLATEEVGKSGSPLIFVTQDGTVRAVFTKRTDMQAAINFAGGLPSNTPTIIEDHTGVAWENEASADGPSEEEDDEDDSPMATKSSILSAELAKLALTGLSLETDGALDEAIPVPLAQRLCAALRAANVEASWAPDHDDAELAWVYVTIDEEEDDEDEDEDDVVRESVKGKRPGLIVAYWDESDPNNVGWSWRAFWYNSDGSQAHEESGGFDGRKGLSDPTITKRARAAAGHGGSRVPVEIRE